MPRRAVLLLSLAAPRAAQIVSLPFLDCAAASSIRIAAVYAQLVRTATRASLNFTLVGASPAQIDYSSNTSHAFLSTVLAPTAVLTFAVNAGADTQSLCRTLRPPSPLPAPGNDSDKAYCPLAPGPLAFAVSTPLSRSYELMTLTTQIRVLDTSDPAQELACVSVAATPLRPAHGSVYGPAVAVFWATVALAAAFWLVVGAARLAAAWKRGRQRVHRHVWSRVQGGGFVLASAISGERFAASPALLRFGTPSMRDVLFHTQWCTLLGMLAVQWPRFAYPFFAQTAWATLLYNISLTPAASAQHWDPLHTPPFAPPAQFADQLADPASPLYLDPRIPNTLFTLPRDSPATGIPALAAAVGIRPQDAFDIAVGLFVLILAGTVVLSLAVAAVDALVASLVRASGRAAGTRTPPWSVAAHKDVRGSPEPALADDDRASGTVRFPRPASRTLQPLPPPPRGWLNYRLGRSSFHGSVLHGNLVRVLVLFHLPVTVFACYQFSAGRGASSLAAVVLAALAFAVFSVALPAWLVLRVSTTPTSKLYDETRTLLALGPLYNHYAHGSQRFACLFFAANLAYGVALGCGQRSGTAQAIVVLVVEVASALATSVWLPWGRGAAMGGISFVLCVARIITAVLLVILSPVVSVGDAAGGWIAYAILVVQGLVYVGFLLMLVAKLVEGGVRLAGDVSFDRSRHTVDTGLLGAIGLVRRARMRRDDGAPRALACRAESESTKQMLPRAVHGNARASHSRTTVSAGGGPPSVLRPEQLSQPYREESDDEGGYILGAWHYDDDPAPDASEPPTPPPPPTPPTAASGFSRVAGGRANLESPFTMAGAAGGGSTALGAGGSAGGSAGASPSGASLPPGAMAPGAFPHVRRKSQSAIIEHADAGGHFRGMQGPGGPVPTSGTQGRDLAHSAPRETRSRRRRWLGFGLFASAGGGGAEGAGAGAAGRDWGEAAAPMLGVDDGASPARDAASSRTFVVIRDRTPRPSPLSQTHTQVPDAGAPPDDASGAVPARSSPLARPPSSMSSPPPSAPHLGGVSHL